MKKRMLAVFLLAMTALLLTGCLRQRVAVVMERDGSGSVACTFSVKQEAYDQLAEVGCDPFDGREYSSSESAGEVWYSVTDMTECATYDEIEDALLALQFPLDLINDPDHSLGVEKTPLFSDVKVEKQTTLFSATYEFAMTVKAQTSVMEEFEPDENYSLKVTVDLPGNEVKEILGGGIEDGKAVFDIASITQAATYSVITSERRWGMTVLVLAGLIAALAVLIWLPCYIRKRQEQENRNYL